MVYGIVLPTLLVLSCFWVAKQTFKPHDRSGEARDVHRAPSRLRGTPCGACGVPGGAAGGVHCTTGTGDLGSGALVPESDGKTWKHPFYPLVILIISTIRWQLLVGVWLLYWTWFNHLGTHKVSIHSHQSNKLVKSTKRGTDLMHIDIWPMKWGTN